MVLWWQSTTLFNTMPIRIQPNCVWRAVGDLGGPCHRPWSITRLNMSAPSKMSTLSGATNHWSASCNPCRCFHFALKGTGKVGNLVVILGSTAASTLQRHPEGVPALLELATWNYTLEWDTCTCTPYALLRMPSTWKLFVPRLDWVNLVVSRTVTPINWRQFIRIGLSMKQL